MSELGEATSGIKIIAGLNVVIGLLLMVAGAGAPDYANYLIYVGVPVQSLLGIGGWLVLIGLLHLGIAYGFWRLMRWAFWTYFIMNIGGAAMNFIGGNTFSGVVNIGLLFLLWFGLKGSFEGMF